MASPGVGLQASPPKPVSSLRYIKDPIHDQIPVSKTLASFIDTKQFQRLRNIKQLGTTSWVWPSATHTRFEHSLGVAYLARLMASHLQRNQPELGISDRDIDCVEIAGLCHDLGHGPWSHVWDGNFIRRALPDSKWKHEHGSEMMFDALVRENDVQVNELERKFIKALISGDVSRMLDKDKLFLFDIVANQRNGLDVDKIDYIHRDSHMIGDPICFSPLRLINSARVTKDQPDQICYNIKNANLIYDLCEYRFKLHKMCYNHKSAKAIEYMIVDALMAAEPVLKFARHINDPDKFVYLTDQIMSSILSSDESELAESRKIFDRIIKRDLYRCVDYKVIDWPDEKVFRDNVTSKEIFKSALTLSTDDPVACELQESDIIVNFTEMHYGKNEKNPLDFMRFYSKLEPDESLKAERGCYSNLMPQYFSEFLLRVYTKNAEFAEIIQAGYLTILKRLEIQHGVMSPQAVDVVSRKDKAREGSVPTPLAAMPTTPKASHPGLPVESPFAPNNFTLHKRNRSISPTRIGPELESAATTPSPSPAHRKRKRANDPPQNESSVRKMKKR